MICPPDRAGALRQLDRFVEIAPRYGWDRNAVAAEHFSVSRLSPAIRHRLITEDEAAYAILAAHPFEKVSKFVQEIYWRRYWKSWLSLRPQVWSEYQISLRNFYQYCGVEIHEKATRGQLGNAVIDHIANELVRTGYLHNHARMWFAAWWIHQARLPWEIGAAFFHSHLLDGDPASNTLSWRWVAGLQTPGKTYLARRANLEKYLSRELRESLAGGLSAFENPEAVVPVGFKPASVTRPVLPVSTTGGDSPAGLWIHEEDLSPECSLLGDLQFRAITVTGHPAGWEEARFPTTKRAWLENALADTAARASRHWNAEMAVALPENLADHLAAWALRKGITRIVTLRPDVGSLDDALPAVAELLESKRIRLVLMDRQRDLDLRPLATGGFFRFWESMVKGGLLPEITVSRTP